MATPKFSNNFDGYKVLDRLIEDRGTTHAFFINGVLVPDFTDQKKSVGKALNLINDLPSSMKLDGAQNPSAQPSMEEVVSMFVARIAIGLIAGGLGVVPLTLSAVGSVITRAILGVAIDAGEALWQIYSDDLTVSNLVNQSWTGADKAGGWLSPTSKDSVIFVPHSQGNLFVEDGLRVISHDPNRVRVIALGSPTDYASAGGLNNNRSANIINSNPDDPITYFQTGSDESVTKLIADTLSIALGSLGGGLETLFSFFGGGNLFEGIVQPLVPFIKSNFPKEYLLLSGIGGTLYDPFAVISGDNGHALGDKTKPQSYLGKNLGVKNKFKAFAHELQPKGYYFISGKEKPGDGTEDEDDWLEGSDAPETINGKGRNDVLWGNGGDDVLIGGSGYDLLDGGSGIDTANYSSSLSGIKVEAAKLGDSDVYKVQDGFGTEDVLGNIEIISGSNFADEMTGGDYTDIFYGQGGNDLFWGQKGDDQFYGGTDNDTAYGGDDNDDLRGDEGSDDLRGQNGNDSLYGGQDNDFLYGGDGEDELRGEQGNDDLRGENGNDTLYGGTENDSLYGGQGEDKLYGEEGDDDLKGEENNDSLYGGTGKDTLDGGTGNDDLRGEQGDDLLKGEAGNDTLYGGDDQDKLYGGLNADLLYGNAGNDQLFGEDGDDILDGGSDNDILIGGSGDDKLYGQSGNDIIQGNTGEDYAEGGSGRDFIQGNEGNDILYGQDGSDTIEGNADDDFIDGGNGQDSLVGNTGDDRIYGQGGNDVIQGQGKRIQFGKNNQRLKALIYRLNLIRLSPAYSHQ